MTDAPPTTAHGWRPDLWDVVLALVVVAVGVWILTTAGGGGGFEAPDAYAYTLTVIGCATTAWWRRQPLAALVVTGLAVTLLVLGDYHVDVLPFVVTGLLFMLANHRPRRAAVLGLAAALVFLAASAATRPADLGLAALLQTLAIFLGVWVLGRLNRSRRTALLALVSEADQRAAAERAVAAAERDRSRLSLVEERLRIARDVHDVLAHSMSVVSVQATVGAHLAVEDPGAARQALLTISDVSRSSMQDLRQMLTLLRDDTAAATGEPVTYEPARGVAALEPLIETYRAAGLPVTLTTSGVARDLTASVDLCAYRIVQEALTNTLKHAGASAAAVALRYDAADLEVVISDDGRGHGPATGGHGLVGMRERADLVGGRLTAGPATAGGFTVTAVLPYAGDSPEDRS